MKRKFLVILLLVLFASVGTFTISVSNISPETVKADALDDASDLCLLLNTYRHPDTGASVVDWSGFYKCVGTIMGWV